MQVLQQVADEDDVYGIVIQKTEIVRTPVMKIDPRLERALAVRIEVDSDSPRGAHLIQKFAGAATEMDDRVAAPDPRLEEIVN
ncbi:hypothetical protein MSAS_02910 [Mycobacterium saskatchewanense]|nr:hypothetical protein MSAS_02910 [Mycobacterium saskatchewanense]